jgi:electron transport protein HydN
MLSPVNFKPRLKVVKGPRMTAPQQCRQCNNAPCVNVCPTNALVYSHNSVQLVEERCVACCSCAIACPFGVMEMLTLPIKQPGTEPVSAPEFVTLPFKCDLCVGVDGGPACISACPTGAIRFVESGSLAAENSKKRKKYVFSLVL